MELNTHSSRKYFIPLFNLGTVCFREIEEDIWIYNFMNLKCSFVDCYKYFWANGQKWRKMTRKLLKKWAMQQPDEKTNKLDNYRNLSFCACGLTVPKTSS